MSGFRTARQLRRALSHSGDLAVLWHYQPLRPAGGVWAAAQLVVFESLAAMGQDAAMPADIVEVAARSLGDSMKPDNAMSVSRYRWRCGACGNEGVAIVAPGKARAVDLSKTGDDVYDCVVDEHGKGSAACPQLRLDLLVLLEPAVWLDQD